MSTPTESPSAAADRDPVQEARDHLEQALAALDRLREVLPPAGSTPPPDTRGGDPA
ncbi:hypothetical protein BJ993_002047 [Nocardioides aromaticivorans]|uniref:Uncharacterized protein n=1 Tax=Nocardioides aromaticivorans TaxID=200618 RepID=A0A7Y9ZGG2_9ACTN|nr:hypothetical protein [Nocardioides aromaticivorans]NYI44967.1 hypothetical protein [Nocardioides aromaticivorans]